MILIAESGSTKCDWVLIDNKGREIDRWNTMGFNPYFHSSDFVYATLSKTDGLRVWAEKIDQTWFYGAGCSTEPLQAIIKEGLDRVFVNDENHVGHDLEAAAYALYEGEPEIACILGTGSNSCYFDGEKIYEEVPSLAYILGDEGSASWIGKRIVSDFLYKRLPEELQVDFKKTYNTCKDEVISSVYNKPHANVYLASFGPFAGKHAEHPYIQNLVKDSFNRFIEVHVLSFKVAKDVPISFVGSVAKVYEDILTKCLDEHGLRKGKVLAKPVNHLIQYHINFMHVLEPQD
jgi:N-acetylglucosamine kinase-like BadF-type ATPase